jgi:hypothetical protein
MRRITFTPGIEEFESAVKMAQASEARYFLPRVIGKSVMQIPLRLKSSLCAFARTARHFSLEAQRPNLRRKELFEF